MYQLAVWLICVLLELTYHYHSSLNLYTKNHVKHNNNGRSTGLGRLRSEHPLLTRKRTLLWKWTETSHSSTLKTTYLNSPKDVQRAAKRKTEWLGKYCCGKQFWEALLTLPNEKRGQVTAVHFVRRKVTDKNSVVLAVH